MVNRDTNGLYIKAQNGEFDSFIFNVAHLRAVRTIVAKELNFPFNLKLKVIHYVCNRES